MPPAIDVDAQQMVADWLSAAAQLLQPSYLNLYQVHRSVRAASQGTLQLLLPVRWLKKGLTSPSAS